MQFPALRATFAALLFGAALSAAPVIGAGTYTAFGANPNQDGSPFWDYTSADGSGCGVGYVLTQTAAIGGCANKRMGTTTGLGLDPLDLEYYSNAGSAVAFTMAAGDYHFVLHAGLYGARLNQVGYTYLSDGIDHLMFSTANSVGDAFDLDAAGEFAFWIKSNNNLSYLFRSNDAAGLRAAAFRDNDSGLYYFGFEDRPQGDKDYNDMVISARLAPIPEPATFVLMGAGLIAVAVIGRKRRSR